MFTGTGRWQMSEACQVKEVSSCRVNTFLEGSIAADSLTDSCCIDTFPCSVATSPLPLPFSFCTPLPRFPHSPPPSLVHPPSSSPLPSSGPIIFDHSHLPFRNWYRLFLCLGHKEFWCLLCSKWSSQTLFPFTTCLDLYHYKAHDVVSLTRL